MSQEKEIEIDAFRYHVCSSCGKKFAFDDIKNKCSDCQGDLTTGLGISPKNDDDKAFLEAIFNASNGYKATCRQCANIFLSQTTSAICPKCNSNQIDLVPNIDGLNARQDVRIKIKDVATGKEKMEMRIEDEKPQADGLTALFTRTIDKENDNYQEKVIINQTGEIKRNCKEPLSSHKGHGSAKNKA